LQENFGLQGIIKGLIVLSWVLYFVSEFGERERERRKWREGESMVMMDMMTLLWSLLVFFGARQSGARAKQSR
jgi:hypothetical protein